MPKVSDYELEHFDDDRNDHRQFKKKQKPKKEKKYQEKKDHRADWKKLQEIESTDDEEE